MSTKGSRALIVHCWGGSPTYCWYPYAKDVFEQSGYKVSIPALPDPNSPKETEWVECLDSSINDFGGLDEHLVLIGHSIGCATILRYLESVSDNRIIQGVIFVAGFTEGLGHSSNIDNSFFNRSFNFKKIKASSEVFVAIQSDRDPFVPWKFAPIFETELNATVLQSHDKNHFLSGDVCLELPELSDALRIINI